MERSILPNPNPPTRIVEVECPICSADGRAEVQPGETVRLVKWLPGCGCEDSPYVADAEFAGELEYRAAVAWREKEAIEAHDREVTARIAEQLSKVRYSGRATRDELKLPRGVRAIIR